MLLLVAPFLVLVAAHFLFRYSYYGEWLPNTYYAKHVRPWYESGFRYLTAAALETGLYLLLPLALLARRSRWQVHRDGSFALPLLCVAAHMAYLLPIGGDHFEFRPLDFYWPLLAVPAAEGIALLGSRISTGLRRFPESRVGRPVGGLTRSRSSCPCCSTPTRFRASFYSRGPRYASKTVRRMPNSITRTRAGCWPRQACQ